MYGEELVKELITRDQIRLLLLTKMAVKVDESCCLCYIKRKKKTNKSTRILISFKREPLMVA